MLWFIELDRSINARCIGDKLVEKWSSGDRSFSETIPTLPWRPDDRLTEDTPISRSVFSCSSCVPVGGAGFALLGGLELRLNLTVLGIGLIGWKCFA